MYREHFFVYNIPILLLKIKQNFSSFILPLNDPIINLRKMIKQLFIRHAVIILFVIVTDMGSNEENSEAHNTPTETNTSAVINTGN